MWGGGEYWKEGGNKGCLVLFRTRLTVQNPVKLVSARGDISRRILKQLQTNISIQKVKFLIFLNNKDFIFKRIVDVNTHLISGINDSQRYPFNIGQVKNEWDILFFQLKLYYFKLWVLLRIFAAGTVKDNVRNGR